MSENDDLLIRVGLTEKQYMQALARMEAQSIKAAKSNEKSFARANKSFQSGAAQANRSANAFASGGLRNMSMQFSQVMQQGAVTGDYFRALSVQLPDMAIGFGAVGVAIGALAPLAFSAASALFDLGMNGDEALKALEDMGKMDLGSARSAISELEQLQQTYTTAIYGSGDASGAAATLVVANASREFEAKKKLIEVELQLMRIRRMEKEQDLQNLKDVQEATRQGAIDTANTLGPNATASRASDAQGYANARYDTSSLEVTIPGYIDDLRNNRLAIEKISAELELLGVAEDEVMAALERGFDVEGGVSGSGRSGSSGGLSKVADDAERAADSVSGLASVGDQAANAVRSAFDGLFDDADAALDNLWKKLLQMAAYQGLGSMFPSVFGATGMIPLVPNANGGVYSSPSLSAYSGTVVSKPTQFAFANGAGLMGEAGPEAILPLTRGANGKLGVQAQGGGNSGAQININNYGSPDDVRVKASKTPDGREVFDIWLNESLASGKADRSLGSRFGSKPRLNNRGS